MTTTNTGRGGGRGRRQKRRAELPPTAKQLDVLRYVRDHVEARGFAPSLRDVCAHMGWRSTNAATDALNALAERGLLDREASLSRGLRVTASGAAALGAPTTAATAAASAGPGAAVTVAGLLREVAHRARVEGELRAAWLRSLPPGACTSPPPRELLDAEAATREALAELGTDDRAAWEARDDDAKGAAQLDLLARLARDGDPEAAAMGRDLLAPGGLVARLRVSYQRAGFDLHGAGWVVRLLATSLVNVLDAEAAENFLEQEVVMTPAGGGAGVRVLVTAVRPGGATPAQILRAERERANRLAAELEALRAGAPVAAAAGAGRA